jgi:hypothetical protein
VFPCPRLLRCLQPFLPFRCDPTPLHNVPTLVLHSLMEDPTISFAIFSSSVLLTALCSVSLLSRHNRSFRLLLLITDSLWRRQSQQSFNTWTPFNFLFYSLHVSAPTGHPQLRYTVGYYFCFWRTILIQRIRWTYAIWVCFLCCCCISAALAVSSWSSATWRFPLQNCLCRATCKSLVHCRNGATCHASSSGC